VTDSASTAGTFVGSAETRSVVTGTSSDGEWLLGQPTIPIVSMSATQTVNEEDRFFDIMKFL
jgi:hypothetical protein